jgi:hypothetical protein
MQVLKNQEIVISIDPLVQPKLLPNLHDNLIGC